MRNALEGTATELVADIVGERCWVQRMAVHRGSTGWLADNALFCVATADGALEDEHYEGVLVTA